MDTNLNLALDIIGKPIALRGQNTKHKQLCQSPLEVFNLKRYPRLYRALRWQPSCLRNKIGNTAFSNWIRDRCDIQKSHQNKKPKIKNINIEVENINHYQKIAHNSLQQELNQIEVGFARSKLTSTPWSNWWTSADSKRMPNDKRVLPWRNAYNQIKHHRVEHYNMTLENTFVAFAALFILIET